MKTFIITGIQMRNKGSQAMFLSLYSGLKAKYPDCEVIGFSNKFDSPEQYAFTLLPYDDYTRLVFRHRLNAVPMLVPLLTTFAGIARKTDKWNGMVAEMEKALRNADAIFDASGYTLGSGWSKAGGRMLLQTIRLAKRYDKKIVLMPQSFGPFDWGEDDDEEFLEEVKEELSYATRVYPREREGYECLKGLGLDNVELSADMVIREKLFPTASEIHASGDRKEVEYPEKGSIGFIINENVFRVGNPGAVLDLYVKLLDKLVKSGEKIYILTTSTADTGLAEQVLDRVEQRDKVGVISGEYSSPELIDIISRFKYVVASRYHSVVFAYRTGVPAIILGWASKYIDLANHFGQQDYVFDIREPGVDRIFGQIDRMSANHETESAKIRDRLEDMQATSVIAQAIELIED
ncbi:polysaccharide pyruvyl transferase family protein [Qipengyuania aquimaris]|uniref:polysaccharide pyruvyl transferase family protein n=1 Tax=Qipengyuania aquimaris TaxID=255984 RepID=UPI001FD11A61|nr:polysaccharide pyruvyl transferase family protein [Qipengyuania aquimaris]UOR16077.1 polysaccharide pyruvyl transferase family protein [Qipengyuania aquimaris]